MKGRYHLPEKANPIRVRMAKDAKIIGLEYPPGQLSLVVEFNDELGNMNYFNTEDRLFQVCGKGSMERPAKKDGRVYERNFIGVIRGFEIWELI